MARAVEWSAAARRDLAEIVRFIAEIDPNAAARVAHRIAEAAIGLGSFEKSVVGLLYVIADALDERKNRRAVVILHVVHGARNWPPGSWPDG